MFNSLTGKINFKAPDRLFLETGGLEWDLAISRFASGYLPEAGNTGKVFTYLYHKEDKMVLYGFYSGEERNLFFDLIKVEGIGPGLAMKILSGMQANDFIAALNAENIGLITSIPGLGKKTAEKIIFKLRGKLTVSQSEDPLAGDIVTALTGMGFDAKKAQETVYSALKEINREALSGVELERELLKTAIKKLGSNS